MSLSTTTTHDPVTPSSSELLSGEKLDRRLAELLDQDRFAPPPQLGAARSVDGRRTARSG